ncbi:MAG: hypothetical protein JSV57_04335 [Candidatus Bathyarchaeota archaeon]|nr:MAG: hypothetical protein JSV57_04335 [Candidatus Bathyarchaeota archaeon]
MSSLDDILESMKDGRWHNLEEMNREVGLSEEKLEEIIRFFAEYKFVQLDKNRRRIRLSPPILAFVTRTQ